jgi:hypothetical protein
MTPAHCIARYGLACLFACIASSGLAEDTLRLKSKPPLIVAADPAAPLDLVVVPLHTPGNIDGNYLEPIKLTDSGYALFRNRLMNSITTTGLEADLPMVAGYRWRDGVFSALNRRTGGAVYWEWDGGALWFEHEDGWVDVRDINENGDVAGIIGTSNGYFGDIYAGRFDNPALWPKYTTQPSVLPVTGIKQTSTPISYLEHWGPDLPKHGPWITNDGAVYVSYLPNHTLAFSSAVPPLHPFATLRTGLPPRAAVATPNETLLAISPSGQTMATSSADYRYSPRSFVVNGATATAPLRQYYSTGFWTYVTGSSIDDSGRYVANGGWAKAGFANALPLNVAPSSTPLAFNSRGDLLATSAAGVPEVWAWHGVKPALSEPGGGVYQKREINLHMPQGWSLEKVTPTLTKDYAMMGTLRSTTGSDPRPTSPALLVPVGLWVDQNRDGEITPGLEKDYTTSSKPFWFRPNDDDDNPDPQPPSPATPLEPIPDYTNSTVDGPDDLKDFFPVFLDIKQLLTVLPPEAGYRYKLKQADGALNFVYTLLTRATAFNYLTDNATTYGPVAEQSASNATTERITEEGVDLADYGLSFLNGIKNDDRGVILVEMRSMSAAPLRLVVEKLDGTEITELAVYIAAGEAKFEALASNAPLSDNKNMGTGEWMPGKGLRIFHDARNNTDTTPRNQVYAKVGLAGATGSVSLRIIDVDDPTPSAGPGDPDYQHLVDPNDASGERGDDNTGDLGGGRSAVFVANNSNELICTLDSDGYARVSGQYPVINVSMRPGDNYRLAVVQTAADLKSLQVTNPAAAGYVAPALAHPRSFKGLASDMLTVWRKIHVEQDTLAAVAISGTESNLEGGRIDSITDLGGGRFRLNLDFDLPGGQNRFQGGTLNIEGQEFSVESNDNNFLTGDDLIVRDDAAGSLATWLASSTTGLVFILEDDDGQYLPSHAILPLAASERLITPYVLEKYSPAYLEPDDSQPNPNRVISFKLNLNPPHPDARDLTDRTDFWAVRLVASFQTTIPEDGDPDSELQPITGEYSAGDACIFLESIREERKIQLSLSGVSLENGLYQFLLDRSANVAHEIGHGPNPDNIYDNGTSDHAEHGLMFGALDEGPGASFGNITIKRFRSAIKWSE